MSLTTKARPHAVHKKISGAHHKHSKSYVKTYWPYLPILGIFGLGIYINSVWHAAPTVRLTNYTYYDIIESSLGVLALSIFLLRHAFAWRKVFIYGEHFVSKHPMLDVCLVSVAVGGLLLAHHIT